jgi:excisionase family DNA binding protein
MKKKYYSIPEYAKMVGVSRIAVYNKVKKGEIKAVKIGRNYAIPEEFVLGKSLSIKDKEEIDKAIRKTVKDYGETLKLLGNE